MSKRLLILAPSELTRDPRARRAAHTALARGLAVAGVCGPGGEALALPGATVIRLGGGRFARVLRRTGLGGVRREQHPLIREVRGLYRLGRLVSLTTRLVATGLRVGAADVVHANDFDTLPAGWIVARLRGARLVYDAHELYAEHEPDPPRLHRLAIRLLERAFARRADAVVTVSDALAAELEHGLRLDHPPLVVLNCPEQEAIRLDLRSDGPLRAVYQSAVGPGREMADLFRALVHAPDVELTLRVLGADRAELERQADAYGVGTRTRIEEPARPDGLVRALAPHDIGLVIDRPLTRNNELAFPNKLFEYLMAGLAVVAPAFPPLAALLDDEGVGVVFEAGNPESLGAALDGLSHDRERVDTMRRRAYEAARSRYHAEAQWDALRRAWGV